MKTVYVKYTDADMEMMFWGEIGAHLMAILAAVMTWMYLGDVTVFLKAPAAIVSLFVAWKLSVWFVHLGYVPEDR